MRPERSFAAARIAALHCPELIAASRRQSDPAETLDRIAADAARALELQLRPILSGMELSASAQPANSLKAGDPVAAAITAEHCLLAAPDREDSILVSVDSAALLTMLVCALGGDPAQLGPIPSRMPPSAELVLLRLLDAISTTVFPASGSGRAKMLRRDRDPTKLAPFAAGSRLFAVELEALPVSDTTAPWKLPIRLVMTGDTLVKIDRLTVKAGTAAAASISPEISPLRHVPVPLRAVLAEIPVSLAQLGTLKPGVLLPLPPAQRVALLAEGRTIGRGQPGSVDGCAAVQIVELV